LQCDEGRPSCAKCRSYGFCCNYSTTTEGFQLSIENVSTITAINPALGVQGLTIDMINAQLRQRAQSYIKASEMFQLDANDFATFNTFQTRTVNTIGAEETAQIYGTEVVRLACQVGS
jgi:hypothetical protein